MFCKKCGAPYEPDERFCGACGEPLTDQPALQQTPIIPATPPVTPVWSQSQQPPTYPKQPAPSSSAASVLNILTFLMICACLVLWFVAPFISINILTLSSLRGQPTALQLVTNDVEVIGNITDSVAFWAAVVSGIGIVGCCILAAMRKAAGLRSVAILIDIILAIVCFYTIHEFGAEFSDLNEIAGIGYIGIFVLLLAASITVRKPAPKVQSLPL